MGYKAAKLLLIEDEENAPQANILYHALIERESTQSR